MSLFPVFAPVASAPATVSYTDNPVSTADLTTYTFSSAALGTAAADRIIVVSVTTKASGGAARTVSSLTIGGVSGTEIAALTTGGVNIAMWYAAVPTGTTGDIVVTWSGACQECGCGVWAVYGAASSPTDFDSAYNGDATTVANTITIPAGGVGIMGMRSSGVSTHTIDNVTENYDAQAGDFPQAGGSDAFAELQTELVITTTISASQVASAISSAWGPA